MMKIKNKYAIISAACFNFNGVQASKNGTIDGPDPTLIFPPVATETCTTA